MIFRYIVNLPFQYPYLKGSEAKWYNPQMLNLLPTHENTLKMCFGSC